MAIMEWVAFIETVCYLGSHLTLYFGLPIYLSVGLMTIWASCGFVLLPVITEEMIKICSIVGPERIVFANGLFQTASQISTAIEGACMGIFFVQGDNKWPLLGGVIMSFIFLMSLVWLSYFEHY